MFVCVVPLSLHSRDLLYVKCVFVCRTTMRPFSSDKGSGKRRITLVEGENIIADDTDLANTLNSFFGNAVKSLGINIPKEHLTDSSSIVDPIDNIILRYSKYPSISRINTYIARSNFSFSEIRIEDIETELTALNSNKASKSDSIPAKEFHFP